MRLSQLLRSLVGAPALSASDTEITGVTDDSRAVQSGNLFVAYPGVRVDGAQFIAEAVRRGAAAIVTESTPPVPVASAVPVVRVPDGRAALAHLAAAWYHHPSRQLRVIGVTGTDGKTTTATLIENILLAAGHTAGSISTVAAHIGGRTMDTGFHTTTPDAPEIQQYLAQMVEMGTEYAVVESTSHGLAQHRLDAIAFDIAVYTNITHEHLDVHGSWVAYRDAKALLLRALATTPKKPRTAKVAVLNADDNERGVFDYLRAIPVERRILYTVVREASSRAEAAPNEEWIFARDVSAGADGLRFVLSSTYGDLPLVSPLLGRYNVSNILAAAGAALARRLAFDAITSGVAMTHGVVGRMERISPPPGAPPRPIDVIVDFAHTPNALANALATARELARDRVVVVFGCAGLRDVQKRAWMGEIAGRLADLTVVTAEDPRTESLSAINAEIESGIKKHGRVRDRDYFVIPDRAAAVNVAINRLARPGDLVLLCGKGHEKSMCFLETEYPWSDQEAARAALAYLPLAPLPEGIP